MSNDIPLRETEFDPVPRPDTNTLWKKRVPVGTPLDVVRIHGYAICPDEYEVLILYHPRDVYRPECLSAVRQSAFTEVYEEVK